MNLDVNIIPHTKIIKLLEENTGENFYKLGLGKGFLHMTAQQTVKENNDKLDFIKS